MNTVSRNPTVRVSRQADEYMSYGDHEKARRKLGHHHHNHNHGRRIFPTRQNLNHTMMSSLSYRQHRAKKRLIFLQSYKLGSVSRGGKFMRGDGKMNKVVAKVKSAAVSVLAFVRGGALRSCSFRSAIRASSPTRAIQYY